MGVQVAAGHELADDADVAEGVPVVANVFHHTSVPVNAKHEFLNRIQ